MYALVDVNSKQIYNGLNTFMLRVFRSPNFVNEGNAVKFNDVQQLLASLNDFVLKVYVT